MHRALRLALASVALVLLGAAPAAADAAGPSDFRAEVTGVSPAVDGVRAEIRGGDSFLELAVSDGRTVIVEGYQGEPYLRFRANGQVDQNRLSTATYLNGDRKGRVTIPADVRAASASTPPEWEPVAEGGIFAWHDHRVHWMQDGGPGVPRGTRVGGAYDPWRVPLRVDGVATEVRGTLVYATAVNPVPYLALAVAAAVVVLWLGRGKSMWVPVVAVATVSLLAVVVGLADFRATPQGGGNRLMWALAAAALAGGVAAAALVRRPAGVVVALGAVASLSGWALFRSQVLLRPVLPTDLPFAVDRATTGLAIGVSVAAGYLAVMSGVLVPADLEEDE